MVQTKYPTSEMDAACIDYKDTGFFSQTVIDYLEGLPELRPFYNYRPNPEGFANLFQNKKVIANREVLVKALQAQYAKILPLATHHSLIANTISLLRAENTFTITTGHQLNIFAGPLYFIFKIVTAIKLSRQLMTAFPDNNFVPVYWMASEDHDFAEISYTNIGGKKVHWWHLASGATGRINPGTIREALNQYKGTLGINGHADELAAIVETAYTKFDKLADATRYLVNALFGQYGLVIIDADDRDLKLQFAPVMERDIIEKNSFKNISATNEKLKALGVHIQVNPREVNFFYLQDGLRERIVFENDIYKVLNSGINFTDAELKHEINQYPERFSPNVVMRPLYQECILPNIAYIGGGAEIVYWLELKSSFDFYKINFPILILRNSGLLINKKTASKVKKMELGPVQLFESADAIKDSWVKKHSKHTLSLAGEWRELSVIFDKIKLKAYQVDGTLAPSADAVMARLRHAIDTLEKKLLKAEKINHHIRLEQVEHIKKTLFPGDNLQERTENFGLFYVKWGQSFIDELIRNFEPLDFKFTVLTER